MDREDQTHSGSSISPRIVVIADHQTDLDELSRIIGAEPEWHLIAACRTAADAIDTLSANPVDLVLVDLDLTEMDDLELVRRFSREMPGLSCVILAAEMNDEELAEAMRNGVGGVVLKARAQSSLVDCIRAVVAGRTYLAGQSMNSVVSRIRERDAERRAVLQKLTPRELEISRLAASGLRSREIAARLGIAPGTVKLHLHSVYGKLNLTTRVELANLAQRLQLGHG
ncbi:response regulator [Sinorhizobium medicae]|uniref:DNA-binding response regulator n=2 Tax=Sinorhizobium medicae TaxID=110321 RepID=A0A508WUN3_9HYPH|nr:response regulator transcription factor [Sinorhizobium medicae]ABR60814.1 two component transcriptional regulator, LuxR family [Sinorhizobium medicae WSM419]MBO1943867.1 response regulator transcription factor [Sinorhizobium medicae]MBO1964945.1 response regulator transcription factor [Sinorhizobium medicae]MDX0406972.1 response regulator [Sinorhizobium medicae]MDX0412601.1 response regulator [Sinorhizobium medicae]